MVNANFWEKIVAAVFFHVKIGAGLEGKKLSSHAFGHAQQPGTPPEALNSVNVSCRAVANPHAAAHFFYQLGHRFHKNRVRGDGFFGRVSRQQIGLEQHPNAWLYKGSHSPKWRQNAVQTVKHLRQCVRRTRSNGNQLFFRFHGIRVSFLWRFRLPTPQFPDKDARNE